MTFEDRSIIRDLCDYLQADWGLNDTAFARVIRNLNNCNAILAGSFPLWFYTKPEQQRKCSNSQMIQRRLEIIQDWLRFMGLPLLPVLVQTQIAEYVRCEEHREYGNSMDVDIFTCHDFEPHSIGLNGWNFIGSAKNYDGFKDILGSLKYENPQSKHVLNITVVKGGIYRSSDIDLLRTHIENFDLSFCAIALQPTNWPLFFVVCNSHSSSFEMTAPLSITKYEQVIEKFKRKHNTIDVCMWNVFFKIYFKYGDHRLHNSWGDREYDICSKQLDMVLADDFPLRIAKRVEDRLMKYTRRGFEITNTEQVMEFIASVRKEPHFKPQVTLDMDVYYGGVWHKTSTMMDFIDWNYKRCSSAKKEQALESCRSELRKFYDLYTQRGLDIANKQQVLDFFGAEQGGDLYILS